MTYSRKAAAVLLIAALLAGVIFLREYLGIFALAALTTLLFTPLHNRFLRKGGRRAKYSTGLTVLVILLAFLLPLTIIIGLSFYEGSQVVKDLKGSNILEEEQIKDIADQAARVAEGVGLNISKESIRSKIEDVARKAIPGIIEFASRTAGNIAKAVTDVIVYLLLLWVMLSRKEELIRLLKRLSPLDDNINDEYLRKVKAMAISMVKGTFVIAVVVSLISTFTLWIIGFPYIAFWFLLFTLLSLIPLGAGIIYVPTGIILLLTGNVPQGVLILLTQFLVLNNIDNILRPRLAPKESKLPGALVLISTFAGVSFFGLLGVVYGPIIMILIYTTIELYDRHRDTGIPLRQPLSK